MEFLWETLGWHQNQHLQLIFLEDQHPLKLLMDQQEDRVILSEGLGQLNLPRIEHQPQLQDRHPLNINLKLRMKTLPNPVFKIYLEESLNLKLQSLRHNLFSINNKFNNQ